ncbi:MAG TPA: TonB-dependent receptor [Gemmatimonadales bacterium]
MLVRTEQGPLENARVTAARDIADADIPEIQGEIRARLTGAAGVAVLRLGAGRWLIAVNHLAYTPNTAPLSLVPPLPADTAITITLTAAAAELEELVVQSTRTGRPLRRVEDLPLRVEVLGRDEIEEKLLMTPGDIGMLLNETGGLRVQTTSPSLGGATIRVQGLRGRYTVLLADGLPLYGGQVGGLGLLQIPPMDLGQLEVIKGAASALYGSSALGGVVNLIARRPGEEPRRELLVNATTLAGADLVGYEEGARGSWRHSLLVGGHYQRRTDQDSDGWTDVPGYRRLVVRPRLFWNGEQFRSLFLTLGLTVEDRDGGTLPGRLAPDGLPFAEGLNTGRLDVGGEYRAAVGTDGLLTIRSSSMTQDHDLRFGSVVEHDRHSTWFGEASLSRTWPRVVAVAGLAAQRDWYRHRDLPGFNYDFTVFGAFTHAELTVGPGVTAAVSARLDRHDKYGTFFNPRVSGLVSLGRTWRVRASAGTGFFSPTPFTETTEVTGLSRLEAFTGVRAEKARSASLDVGGFAGLLEVNLTLFGSVIDEAVDDVPAAAADRIVLVNLPGPTHTAGAEGLARYRREVGSGAVAITASYTYVRATEPLPDGSGRREVPLTPRHSLGVVGVWEGREGREGRERDIDRGWRVGVETYFTGRQALEDNPFLNRSRSYVVFGVLVERRLGRLRLFVNGENLFGSRQTRHAPLVRPSRAPDGRWTTDAWAPLEGRVVNGGLRIVW